MKLHQLLEALKPSQYRNFVKGWDKSKYADLFGGKYRIYIPLGEKAKEVKPNPEVESFVKNAGYEIEDYLTGIASKDNGKRQVKIGKLLAKEPELKKMFDKDSKRSASKTKYIVVISRHPYDIAGMTTGRKWKSCMNLKDEQGKRYIPIEINEGVLIAYLIKETDTNIEHPSARILIKPFVNLDGSGDIAFGVEEGVTYGSAPDEFKTTVVDWADKINKEKKLNGVFQLNDKMHIDSLNRDTNIRGIGDVNKNDVEIMRMIKKDPDYFKKLDKPSEELQKMAVNLNPFLIVNINKPSEAVQLAAVKKDGFIIGDIIKMGITPSEQVQLAAVKDSLYAYSYIKKPYESVTKYYEDNK